MAKKKRTKHVCPIPEWKGIDEVDVNWFAVTLGGLLRAHARATSTLAPATVNEIFDQEKKAAQDRWNKFVLDYLHKTDKI